MPSAISTQRDVRWVSLCVLCTGMLMIVLDIAVVNVALPSIQHDLGFSQASWLGDQCGTARRSRGGKRVCLRRGSRSLSHL